MAVKGMDKLFKKLDRIASQSTYTKALQESGEVVKETAQNLCPVETGNLKDSIEAAVENGKCTVGSKVPYAVFVEYGTIRKHAEPFLGPALYSNRKLIISNIKRAIR